MRRIFKFLGRSACVAAVAICAIGLVGCEEELDQTEPNLQAAWRAPFADALVTISLYPDNTYEIEADPGGKTAGQQLYSVGPFGKIPPMGGWRLDEGEIVFSEEGRTIAGLEVIELTEDNALLKASDGSAMYFDRKRLNGTSAFGGGGALSGWGDEMDDMNEDGATDEDDAGQDDDAATQEAGDGATTRPAGR